MEIRAWIAARPGRLEVCPSLVADPSLKLGAGESEAIALALELRADVLLLDDRKACLEAKARPDYINARFL